MPPFTESIVEAAALDWLADLGYVITDMWNGAQRDERVTTAECVVMEISA